ADLEIMFRAMQGGGPREADRAPTASSEPPRLSRLRGFFDRRAEPAMKQAMDAAAAAIAGRGATIVDLDDPVDFESILHEHRRVAAPEAAAIHSDWLRAFPDDYPPQIRVLIEDGRSLLAVDYVRARDRMDETRKLLQAALARGLDA